MYFGPPWNPMGPLVPMGPMGPYGTLGPHGTNGSGALGPMPFGSPWARGLGPIAVGVKTFRETYKDFKKL